MSEYKNKPTPTSLEFFLRFLLDQKGTIAAISEAAIEEAERKAELQPINPPPGIYAVRKISTNYTPEGRSGQLVRSGYKLEISGVVDNSFIHGIDLLQEFVVKVNPDRNERGPRLVVPENRNEPTVLLAPEQRNSYDGEIFVDGTPRMVRVGSSVKISKFHSLGIEQLLEGKVVTQYPR